MGFIVIWANPLTTSQSTVLLINLWLGYSLFYKNFGSRITLIFIFINPVLKKFSVIAL